MPISLNPYLHFDGQAREALDFYASLFGGTPEVMTFAAFTEPNSPDADRVMHGFLRGSTGIELMAADSPSDQPITGQGDGRITCTLSGDDEEALTQYWSGLSDGGQIQVPFEKQMWGDVFGMCVDRYGIAWMINVAGGQG